MAAQVSSYFATLKLVYSSNSASLSKFPQFVLGAQHPAYWQPLPSETGLEVSLTELA